MHYVKYLRKYGKFDFDEFNSTIFPYSDSYAYIVHHKKLELFNFKTGTQLLISCHFANNQSFYIDGATWKSTPLLFETKSFMFKFK